MIDYDIIICGGGLSGLSLVYRAFKEGIWKSEKVLIIDRDLKKSNDRTWSFWAKDFPFFNEVISHKWENLVLFSNAGERIDLDSSPYNYNTIKGLDFYNYVHDYLENINQVSFIQGDILSVENIAEGCEVRTANRSFTARYVFSSLFKPPQLKQGEQYFLQHFRGVKIKTDQVKFDVNEAYLMDFRTAQTEGATFFYTLPLLSDTVFVEYTVFSKALLDREVYDQKIKEYLRDKLKIDIYEILEDEFGVIPMTDHDFSRRDGNIIYLGTAGGDTRPSTGYTFVNVQKTITLILDEYRRTGLPLPSKETISSKFKLYDSTLLNVLDDGRYSGHQVFTDLFKRTAAHNIFAFLDGETTLSRDVLIMKSLRVFPFAKAFIKVLLRKL